MKVLSIQLRFCKLTLISFFLAPTIWAQSSAPHIGAAPPEQHLRSRLFIYDLHNGSSRLVYTADSIWEAPNWSPDGKYLIANSGGGIYKLVLKHAAVPPAFAHRFGHSCCRLSKGRSCADRRPRGG